MIDDVDVCQLLVSIWLIEGAVAVIEDDAAANDVDGGVKGMAS